MVIDFVEIEDKYCCLCVYLFENVLVVDSEDVKVVILSGDWIVLGCSGWFICCCYSIFGGFVGLFEGKKIGWKKNFEIFEKVIVKVEEEE